MSMIHMNDSVHWYMNELTSRVVAESGIPNDRFHYGKIILQCFRDDPDFISQIDGATGESETAGSLMKRSIQCAISFRNHGLKRGDVMVLMAPNHLYLAVPFYAAAYLGIIAAPVDRTLKVKELEYTFSIYNPKIIFCQSEKIPDIEKVLKIINSNAKVVTFDKYTDGSSFSDFLEANDEAVEKFKPEEYNAEDTIGFLVPTSGTTGIPKGAAVTYKAWMITGPSIWVRCTIFPSPTRMALILAPPQWLTALVHYVVAPYMRYTRLQTSNTVTEDHTRYLIETYRPTFVAISTTMMTQLLKQGEQGPCDISSFDQILIGGSAVHKEVITEVKGAAPKANVINCFGMSELTTIAFQGEAPPGSSGRPLGIYQYRLVDIETQEDIHIPNKSGELWIKGPGMFKEYYNNPLETKEAFAEDGWFKTGDLFYRDEHWNYYFVDRIKLLLKYMSYQISPVEIEAVIRDHPGVLDVAVTGMPDPECGDLPVACVVPRPGYEPSAQEIKDLVKDALSEAKQLRGGVAFINQFPLTASTKIDRRKLRDMVREIILE